MEEKIDYCDYLINEITTAMNTLRAKYPETIMKIFVSSYDICENENSYYIDGLDCSFVFE
jgi:hypothetical protein